MTEAFNKFYDEIPVSGPWRDPDAAFDVLRAFVRRIRTNSAGIPFGGRQNSYGNPMYAWAVVLANEFNQTVRELGLEEK